MSKSPSMMLSTTDNEYSPFDNWTAWLARDITLGYDTSGLLARYAFASESLDDDAEIEAMSRIVADNYSGKHIVVVPEDYENGLRPRQ